MIPLGKIRLTSPKLPFTRADFLNSLLALKKKKNSCSHLPFMQAVNIAVLSLICTLMQTGLRHQNDYENKQVMEAWWRGWRWSSLLFLEQLAERSGAGFLNDWVENLAPNPTETLVPSHSYLSTLFTNHHHNPSQRKNPHWMWCDSFHTFTQQMCTKKPFRWNSSRWASW